LIRTDLIGRSHRRQASERFRGPRSVLCFTAACNRPEADTSFAHPDTGDPRRPPLVRAPPLFRPGLYLRRRRETRRQS
jgi:hypothetical protein